MSGKGADHDFGAFGPWAEAGLAWSEAMAGFGAEWLRFLSARLGEDVAVQERLATATSAAEAGHIQAEFLQRAIEQYTAETGRMVEMTAEMAERLGLPKPA